MKSQSFSRSLWFTVLLLNAMVASVAWMSVRSSRDAYTESTQTATQNLALAIEGEIAGVYASADLALRTLVDEYARYAQSHRFSADDWNRALRRQRSHLPLLSGLRATDADGNVIWGLSLGDPANANIANREYFQGHRNDPYAGLIVSLPVQGRVSGQWSLVLSRRLNAADGGFAGVVAATIPLEYFGKRFHDMKLGEHGSIAFRDSQMRLILRYPELPDGPQFGMRYLSEEFKATLARDATRGSYRAGTTSIDGIPRYHSYRLNRDYAFYVNVGVAEDDALAEWRIQTRKAGGIVFLFVVTTVLLAIWLQRSWRATADATDRLAQREADFRQLAEYSPYGLVFVAPDGHVVYLNPAFTKMLGYTLEDLPDIDAWWHKAYPDPDYRAAVMAEWHGTVVEPGASGVVERGFTVCARDGKPHEIRFQAVTMGDGRIVTTLEDVTEQKRNEDELRVHRQHLEQLVSVRTAELAAARDAAEAASRAKSAFLANMSHELRTPLNGIMGMIDIVLGSCGNERDRHRLATAQQASRHLLAIINDILDISKIEAQRLELEQVDFTLDDILHNLRSILAQKAESQGLALRLEAAAELRGTTLRGDPVRFGQILVNLVGNAIKFTERGSVTTTIRSLSETPEAVLLRVEVTDTGIGISAEELSRLFTAFEQADSSMTRKYGGTGLGLAISKRLVELMGGTIGVTSTPGEGSTFWFEVRLARSATSYRPGRTGHGDECERIAALHAGARVLLVEDEPVNREVAHSLLETAGLHVTEAEDGVEAVAIARCSTFDLILMDIRMPNLNGLDATAAIRADSQNTATPIVAMTANAFSEDRQNCIDAGMNDHIAKPVAPDVFYRVLLKWLEGPRDAPAPRC